MPIHLTDLDVVSEAEGVRSALIVPCNMCPAVSAAVDEGQPFMKLFGSWVRSAPFERCIKTLQSRLAERGVATEVFRNPLYYQWFMCMWTERRRQKLQRRAKRHDAVIVLGCDTANETVREAVEPIGVRVIEGMEAAGLMNARMRFRPPGSIGFEDCRIVPIAPRVSRQATAQH